MVSLLSFYTYQASIFNSLKVIDDVSSLFHSGERKLVAEASGIGNIVASVQFHVGCVLKLFVWLSPLSPFKTFDKIIDLAGKIGICKKIGVSGIFGPLNIVWFERRPEQETYVSFDESFDVLIVTIKRDIVPRNKQQRARGLNKIFHIADVWPIGSA